VAVARFVVVPQWQGSGSSRAMRLIDGAETIRGDLPSAATTVVDVPLEAGDERASGVRRLGSIEMVRDRVRETLAGIDDVIITIGGDCGVELGAIERALEQNPDLAVVWFDAHGDLETPESSASHAFCGMVLRTLVGDGVDELVPRILLDPARIVLAGARDLTDDEDAFVKDAGVRLVDPLALETPDDLLAAVRATGATAVYVHIDVDVLDPGEFAGKTDPVPFGVTPGQLVAAIRALRAELPLAGAGICEFAPANPGAAVEDMGTLLRVIGALTAPRP
jgi:arginase